MDTIINRLLSTIVDIHDPWQDFGIPVCENSTIVDIHIRLLTKNSITNYLEDSTIVDIHVSLLTWALPQPPIFSLQ